MSRLERLIEAAASHDPAGIRITQEDMAYLDRRGADGMTPLFVAVLMGSLASVQNLIAAGADVNRKNSVGEAPILIAVQRDPAKAKLLIDAGADVNVKDSEGRTPLEIALMRGDFETADALVAKGANPNKPASSGMTLLGQAAQRGLTNIITFLLEHNADPKARDRLGKTAADYAQTDNLKRLLNPGMIKNMPMIALRKERKEQRYRAHEAAEAAAAPPAEGGRRKTRRRNIRRRTQRARGKRVRGGVVPSKPKVIPPLEQLREQKLALTLEIWELEHKPNQNAEDVARLNEAEKELDELDNRIVNHPEMLALERIPIDPNQVE